MMSAAEALAAEGAAAGRGLYRLATFDPRWADGFDASAAGFLRSFIAPLLALPLALMAAAVLAARPSGASADPDGLAAVGLAHLISALGFPALLGIVARPLGFQAGFGAFVVVTNWAGLALNAILALAAAATLAGPQGLGVFRVAILVLLLLSVFLTWRAARETLTHETAPALLVVVMAVAVSALSERVADGLVGLASPV